MWFPSISGVIERRILINYQVDGEVATRFLPRPFRPQLVDGKAIVGVCLIRLRSIRPSGLPAFIGLRSENAAHRIAVVWSDRGVEREGVFVPRRDTSSAMNALAGGRIFPGLHHRSQFDVTEGDGRFLVAFLSEDGTSMSVDAQESADWNATSVFPDLNAASTFMQRGAVGFSPSRVAGAFQGLELRTHNWQVTPLNVEAVHSSFFMNKRIFPEGSVKFDGAMLMRDIPHEWHSTPGLRS